MKNQMATAGDAALSLWQRKQAAMIYFYCSDDFLHNLHKVVTDLVNGFVDPLLDLAAAQGRDVLLVDPAWGSRNTSENWANYAWPMLKDLQVSLVNDIAQRKNHVFERTAVNECLRGIEQFSMQWATPDEEDFFTLAMNTLSQEAIKYDDIVALDRDSRLTDFNFSVRYPGFLATHKQIPRFQVRKDIFAKTGEIPPKTGVYVDLADPHASLQFAWAEGAGRQLRMAKTFNDIGLAALQSVGRECLWTDVAKMFEFATSKKYAPMFVPAMTIGKDPIPEMAPGEVARQSFTQHPAQWNLVEIIDGFEDLTAGFSDDKRMAQTHRIVGGEQCLTAGYYFTPAIQDSRRYFSAGEITPNFEARYGQTFWQWDANQE